jgi:putative aminopeptidase FrvX
MNNKFDWNLLKKICSAPSPIGFEASMTFGIIEPIFKSLNRNWIIHKFKGSAGIVLEKPGKSRSRDVSRAEGSSGLSAMVIGHADKIRVQVRSID